MAGLAALWLAMPATAAVTLTDGQAVAGLEPTPGEAVPRPQAPDASETENQWFWYHVAAEGLGQDAPAPAPLPLAELADLLAAEFAAADGEGAAVVEGEALIQTSGAGRHDGTGLDAWPIDLGDVDTQTVLGMRVGRADLGPQTPALALMGGGLVLGGVVRRRRT